MSDVVGSVSTGGGTAMAISRYDNLPWLREDLAKSSLPDTCDASPLQRHPVSGSAASDWFEAELDTE